MLAISQGRNEAHIGCRGINFGDDNFQFSSARTLNQIKAPRQVRRKLLDEIAGLVTQLRPLSKVEAGYDVKLYSTQGFGCLVGLNVSETRHDRLPLRRVEQTVLSISFDGGVDSSRDYGGDIDARISSCIQLNTLLDHVKGGTIKDTTTADQILCWKVTDVLFGDTSGRNGRIN